MGWGPRNAPQTTSSTSSPSSTSSFSYRPNPAIKQEPVEYSPFSSLQGSMPSQLQGLNRPIVPGFSNPPTDFRPLPPHMAPPPQPSPLSNPLSPAQPDAPFLPLFNQTASQRRLIVDYPAEFAGPPHAGRWVVKCVGTHSCSIDASAVCNSSCLTVFILVNGILKGQGTGPSKQLAKEDAARIAFHAMGWAGRK
jgi:hypothetical protein